MKLAAYHLAFFLFMIFADIGSAIYAYYFSYNPQPVCIQIISALKNCILCAKFLKKFLCCNDDLI
jgi:hypothetical protein